MRAIAPNLNALEVAAKGLTEQVKQAVAASKALNAAARKKVRDPERLATIATLRAESRAAWEAFREARSAVYDSAELSEASAADRARLKAAHTDATNCGLAWGSALDVAQSARGFRRGAPPRFRRRPRTEPHHRSTPGRDVRQRCLRV